MSIQNSTCDTNKWLTVDFVSPKALIFSQKCTDQLGSSQRSPDLIAEFRGGSQKVKRREWKRKGREGEGRKGRN